MILEKNNTVYEIEDGKILGAIAHHTDGSKTIAENREECYCWFESDYPNGHPLVKSY